jgi:DNA-binding MarR family transcriptional regulator
LIAQRTVADALAGAGARRAHVTVLANLAEFGPLSQADLGRRCGIDRSDMVELINELSAQGIVARTPDAVDRRRNVISITEIGEQRLVELRALVDAAQLDLLAGLTTEERAILITLLSRLVESHPEFVAGGWSSPGSEKGRE